MEESEKLFIDCLENDGIEPITKTKAHRYLTNIPKYVSNLLDNSKIDFTCSKNDKYAVGYTFRVEKRTAYERIETFEKRINKVLSWAAKYGADTNIISIPKTTTYNQQYAIITITDPVMKNIEHLIKEK